MTLLVLPGSCQMIVSAQTSNSGLFLFLIWFFHQSLFPFLNGQPNIECRAALESRASVLQFLRFGDAKRGLPFRKQCFIEILHMICIADKDFEMVNSFCALIVATI